MASSSCDASSSATRACNMDELGYEYITQPEAGSFLLRKLNRPDEGFSWEGQEHFDALGKAVFAWSRRQLVELCALQELRAVDAPAVAYGTPDLREREAPLLLLICGDVPGGDAGVWSRNLSINQGTVMGTMFEYIFRAQQRGWSVIVADPHGSDASPHAHVCKLWRSAIKPSKATKLLLVGHSYGGPVAMGFLKAEPAACDRLGAIVTTDGMAWGARGWDSIEQLDESVPPPSALEHLSAEEVAQQGGPEEVQSMAARCRRFAEAAPAAFAAPPRHVRQCVAAVGRNYKASRLATGTPVRVTPDDALLEVSAGHTQHGATTMSAVDSVFAFLERGADGSAAEANAEVRAAPVLTRSRSKGSVRGAGDASFETSVRK